LFRAGYQATGASRKRHRPMGLSGAFVQGVLATVDGIPNQRLDQVLAKPGMKVLRQNFWPAPQIDLLSLFKYLPARWVRGGFEHARWVPSGTKRFLIWERLLAFLAGEGTLQSEAIEPAILPGRKLSADLVVIGGGPAGRQAANAAAGEGKRVVLIARGRMPGRTAAALGATMPPLHDAVTLLMGHEAVGIYRDGTLVVAAPLTAGPAVALECRELALAIGKRSAPPLVPGNLLPGVMDAPTALAMASRPMAARSMGRTVVIGTDQRDKIADRLRHLGIDVAAVAPHVKLRRIIGGRRVEAIDLDGQLACETLVHAGPWITDPNLPFQLRSNGVLRLKDQDLAPAYLVGSAAEADQAIIYDPAAALDADICPCMDVTAREITELLQAGMSHVEELKRQTSCGMGPCQGFPCWDMMAAVCRQHLGPGYQPDRPSHRAPRRGLTVAQAAGLHDMVEPVK
ncbi:MAG TPA: FAD-dependent oxidoreductase, partial [Dongiaceae bacterium]|nr:FAD-dependent oxidoreductase [Dongiaceae bacterium]